MSSPRPPNNGNVQYPALPGIPGTSAETLNDNSGTNSIAQGLTRSSGRKAKIALESLGPIDNLSQSQLREQQQYEIDRIINSNLNEALGQFHHADKATITQVYKQLSILIHPDKQPDEWKEKANQTQQILNNARDKFDISIITPEVATERPKRSHKTYWDSTPFIATVRRLQIDPSNEKAIAFIETVNRDIEIHNDKYQSTQVLRTTHKNATDPEQKKELTAVFKALCIATQEFCKERGFPETWAWQYENINEEPAWLSEAEGSQSNSITGTGNGASTGPGSGTGPVAGTGTATGNGNDAGSGSGSGSGPGSGPGSVSDNHDDTEMRDAGDPPAVAESANNSDTGIGEAMDKLTLDGEPIKAKRTFFNDFQYLVQEKSGLYMWKLAGVPPNLERKTIKTSEKLTKEFIA
ncbi:MAG: hypothetical protein Q9217_005591 [Psora testacea]